MNSLRRPALLLLLVCCCAVATSPAEEPPMAPVLRIEAGAPAASIARISADASGRLALTASYDKTARLWELPSGRLLKILRPPLGDGNEGKLYAGALSPDGSVAAVGGYTGAVGSGNFSVYVFDTATGRLARRLEGLPNGIVDLAFSAQGRFLAAVLFAGDGLRVWETATGREVARDSDYGNGNSMGVDWHGEDRLVTACYDGNLRLYQWTPGAGPDSDAGKLTLLKRTTVQGGAEPFSARFSPDGLRIAVGFFDSTSVAVVDGNDLSYLFAPDTTGVTDGNLSAVTWTDDGATLAAGGMWARDGNGRTIRRWPEAGRGQPGDSVAALNTIMDLRPLPGGRILFGACDPAWGTLEPTGQRQLLGPSPIADYRDNWDDFRVADDGTVVAFGYQQFGKIPARFSPAGRRLTLLNGQSPPTGRQPTLQKDAALPLQASMARDSWRMPVGLKDQTALAVLRAPRIEGLMVTDWKYTYAPKLDGKPLPLRRYEMSRSLAIARDASSILLGTDWHLRSFAADGTEHWRMPAPDVVWAVNLADDDHLAVAAYGDGTIRWHRADTGQELLAFFPHADRKRWVLWTPEGYYDCSPGAEDLIGWHVNRGEDREADFFPAAKFRQRSYRPDVIARVLETRDVAAALTAANEAAGRQPQPAQRIEDVVAEMRPPVVELAVGGARGEASVPGSTNTFTLRYRVRRGGAEAVTRVAVLVDGRPVSVEAPIPANDPAEASASVPLPPRDCAISVLAQNKFAVSEPVTLRIVHAADPVAKEPAALKPRLYLLAAGIAHYKNNDQLPDLVYPPKDARDFAAAFQRQEGSLYQKVEARVLVGDQAGANDIRAGLEWIKHRTTVRDVAVIFLSGHGESDEELRFYFCGKDYDRAQRLSTGVSIEEIKKTISSMPGKVLFFIDSCHAGNAPGKLFAAQGVGGNDLTQVINELSSAESGAIVFASSTGRQQSLESDEWKNGAFTKAIVEGLDGKADLLQDGKITVSTLQAFVASRVEELTAGRQAPTGARPRIVPDFPIAVTR